MDVSALIISTLLINPIGSSYTHLKAPITRLHAGDLPPGVLASYMPHPCYPARFIAELKKFDRLRTIFKSSKFVDGEGQCIEDADVTCIESCKVPEADEHAEASDDAADDDGLQDNRSDSSIGELYPGEAQDRRIRPPVKHCPLCIIVSLH